MMSFPAAIEYQQRGTGRFISVIPTFMLYLKAHIAIYTCNGFSLYHVRVKYIFILLKNYFLYIYFYLKKTHI